MDRKMAVRQGPRMTSHRGPIPFRSHTPARAPSFFFLHPQLVPRPLALLGHPGSKPEKLDEE